MKYTLTSDFHLGTKRQAHTTRESSERLKESVFLQARAITMNSPHTNLFLGDLFDRSYNDEATLRQAMQVAGSLNAILSGNHDETNRVGSLTSLQFVKTLIPSKILSADDLSKPCWIADGKLKFVPHHASQTLFEQALEEVMEQDAGGYLFLHCSYDLGFATEDNTLNLTSEMADKLLQCFTRIFIGHEHNSRELKGGRLVLVGNHHPTSFSDLSDKYSWVLDTDADTVEKTLIWSKEERYREVKLGDVEVDLRGVQFVDVVGGSEESGVEVAQFIRTLWDTYPKLLAVRNRVVLNNHLSDVAVDEESARLTNLPQRIRSELEGTEMLSVFNRMLAEAGES